MVIKEKSQTAKTIITTTVTTANPTANNTSRLDEKGEFFVSFLFLSFMMDFCKLVLEEIEKTLTNVGFNSPIFAHAATFIEASAVNYFPILGKLWEKSLHLKIVVTTL